MLSQHIIIDILIDVELERFFFFFINMYREMPAIREVIKSNIWLFSA